MTLKIGIPKEIHPAERRVAATPQSIIRLKKLGFDVAVQAGAGHEINCTNGQYREAGAEIVEDVPDTR
jgi:NAD(P) transhydrogenase subunit alpha